MAEYKLTQNNNVILRVADNAFIPKDESNKDYHEYLEWISNGGIPDPFVISREVMIENVLSERARRLALGFDYDFGDTRGIHRIGTTEQDMKGWDEVTKVTNAMIALNDTTSTINIVTNTGPTSVTAMEWQQVLIAAGIFRQPIWAASFVLQSMDPIPLDYMEDIYWP
mgnify:CR=1 FL=1